MTYPAAALDLAQSVDPNIAVFAAGVALNAVAYRYIKLINGIIIYWGAANRTVQDLTIGFKHKRSSFPRWIIAGGCWAF